MPKLIIPSSARLDVVLAGGGGLSAADGRRNRVAVRVSTPSALLIFKALAMGQRDKPKDAYDTTYSATSTLE